MQLKKKILLTLVAVIACARPAFSEATEQRTYPAATSFSGVKTLGSDLYGALPPKYQSQIHVEPVALETEVMPSVKPVEYPNDPQPLRLIFISVGFIDLMNYVAHAKAIDKLVQKGYFDKYIAGLAQEAGDMSLREPPGLDNPKFWTDAVMNEQQSNFNQMAGIVEAIELSHHYLGHFRKYAEKLSVATKGKPVTINNLLTPAEWDEAVKAGARNALDCGYGVEGVKLLYDTLDKMPKRPVWTAYFLPDNSKVSKIKKDLETLEKNFFRNK